MLATTDLSFEAITVADLAAMPATEIDALPFGVVGLDHEGLAIIYNMTEQRMAGLAPERVIGAPFFDTIAQCMNNFLVAQRFEDESDLDAIVPFVLTLRMRPTPVRLRLLASRGTAIRFVLIQR